jgi:hypothetical protein
VNFKNSSVTVSKFVLHWCKVKNTSFEIYRI